MIQRYRPKNKTGPAILQVRTLLIYVIYIVYAGSSTFNINTCATPSCWEGERKKKRYFHRETNKNYYFLLFFPQWINIYILIRDFPPKNGSPASPRTQMTNYDKLIARNLKILAVEVLLMQQVFAADTVCLDFIEK